MAPDYNKPPLVFMGSNLFESLCGKLAGYITAEDLHEQLYMAYYTYDTRDATMQFRVDTATLGNAFEWACTCQGGDFWSALDDLSNKNTLGATRTLEELLND